MSALPQPIPAEQLEALASAHRAFRKIRRAIVYAQVDGWTLAVFGALTLLYSIPSLSVAGVLVGTGLVLTAYVEIKSSRALARLDERAPRRLAWNQMLLSAILLGYAMYAFTKHWNNPEPFVRLVEPRLMADPNAKQLIDSGELRIEDFVRFAIALIYGTLALVALTVQPITAAFYLTRAKHLRRYLAETSGWITDAQRAGNPLPPPTSLFPQKRA